MSVPSVDMSSKFALDTKGMGDLKQSAKAGSPEALKSAATQFEAMFINMMMKSMRDATPQDELTGSEQSKMFTGMLDQQMSQNMAKRGVGLADMLIRQL
ncbi:MAG: rod-binding protein, partial [Telluria sp.]